MGLFNFLKKEKKNDTVITLLPLAEPYVDEQGKCWQTTYKYDYVDIETIKGNCANLQVNQAVEFKVVSDNMKEPKSVEVIADGKVIGYPSKSGQRFMIRDFQIKDEALVRAQVSSVGKNSVQLQIFYYRSKALLDKQREEYEAEKSAYVRKPTLTFDVTLNANKNERMQYDISCCKVGDNITVMEDDDDKYLVSVNDVLDIGYLPKRIVNKLLDLEDEGYDIDCEGKILEITLNDSGKMDVKVQLVLKDKTYL